MKLKKPLLMLAVILLSALFSFPSAPKSASALNVYALVNASDAYLYRNNIMDDSLENRYFLLPKTYFVQIIQQNAGMGIHRVRYKDVEGYCLSEKLDIKDYTPKSIYPPTVSLKISIEGPSVNLRSRPDTSAVILEEIPKNTTGIEYYNVSIGSVAAVSGTNNVWYFVNYPKDDDNFIKGYIYSEHIILESIIPEANDTTALLPPLTELPEPDISGGNLNNADSFMKTVIIISITIPALAIIFFIFKPLKPAPKDIRSINEKP